MLSAFTKIYRVVEIVSRNFEYYTHFYCTVTTPTFVQYYNSNYIFALLCGVLVFFCIKLYVFAVGVFRMQLTSSAGGTCDIILCFQNSHKSVGVFIIL
jgi:hypothetical protein